MRVLMSIILALIMLLFFGCQYHIITANSDLPKDDCMDIHRQDCEIHAQSRIPHVDSLGIWECYIETDINPSCRFYFDNGKLKRWGH
jgi:hypothetical protein